MAACKMAAQNEDSVNPFSFKAFVSKREHGKDDSKKKDGPKKKKSTTSKAGKSVTDNETAPFPEVASGGD